MAVISAETKIFTTGDINLVHIVGKLHYNHYNCIEIFIKKLKK